MRWGKLNAARDNALVVCHALTGNGARPAPARPARPARLTQGAVAANVEDWWGELLGSKKAFDDDKYMVICLNVLGSCYGTCGPTSVNPITGKPYSGDFPLVTVRDSVRLHGRVLTEHLGVREVVSVVGGSMGGMQALEWTFLEKEKAGPRVRSVVAVACNGQHGAWQIGFSECQRQAIMADPLWADGHYDLASRPWAGLEVAREIAMISYRTNNAYKTKFGRLLTTGAEKTMIEDRTLSDQWYQGSLESEWKHGQSGVQAPGPNDDLYQVQNYLKKQGARFVERKFDPNSYLVLCARPCRPAARPASWLTTLARFLGGWGAQHAPDGLARPGPGPGGLGPRCSG